MRSSRLEEAIARTIATASEDDSRTYREVVALVLMLALLPWLALAVIWWLA